METEMKIEMKTDLKTEMKPETKTEMKFEWDLNAFKTRVFRFHTNLPAVWRAKKITTISTTISGTPPRI